MKRFAFLVLVFAAAAFAEQPGVKQWAELMESDEESVKMCLSDVGTTEAEIQDIERQLEALQSEDINDDIKKKSEKYTLFLACNMEKAGMLTADSKLVVDKIMESIEKEKDESYNKEFMKKCLITLNEDDTLSREDRTMGLTICVIASSESKNKKK